MKQKAQHQEEDVRKLCGGTDTEQQHATNNNKEQTNSPKHYP
jgi:hypothetical protein